MKTRAMKNIRLHQISTLAPDAVVKDKIKKQTAQMAAELGELQNRLYASKTHSVLLVLQGMDASGKDGAVRHVFSPLNPQGVEVTSFKQPSPEEAAHDFLWRAHRNTPAKGMIQVFNRSYYEDILVTRVHGWCDKKTADQRIRSINAFEELLENNHTHIVKCYLHVSEKEQKERLKERTKDPSKRWKYDRHDKKEVELRDEYIKMYEYCFRHCSRVPWLIVPSDQNWYKEYLITKQLHGLLRRLHLKYPGLK